jgi:hypothetical protein
VTFQGLYELHTRTDKSKLWSEYCARMITVGVYCYNWKKANPKLSQNHNLFSAILALGKGFFSGIPEAPRSHSNPHASQISQPKCFPIPNKVSWISSLFPDNSHTEPVPSFPPSALHFCSKKKPIQKTHLRFCWYHIRPPVVITH